MSIKEEIESLISKLGSSDPQIRKQARLQLMESGLEAMPYLSNALRDRNSYVRHEAAKALGGLKNPSTAPALVESLLDESIEVHWAASEALIAIGQDSILPVLKGIVKHFDSYRFRQGAYHVLNILNRTSQLDPHSSKVLEALGDIQSSASAPWAAQKAIEVLEIFKK
jgi:HEAT repeat protein